MKRVAITLSLLLAAVVLGGCGSALNQPERATLAGLSLGPPPPPPSSVTASVKCSNPYASFRPPAPMPAPRAMPPKSFMAQILRHGYLRAGVDQNTLLFAYFDPRGRTIQGFEIDLLKQVADAIFGNKPGDIRFRAITTAERIHDVQNGTVDIVADAMTITCARKQQVDFSTVYYDAGQKILVPSNSTARSVADLGGKRVCATRSSTSIDKLATLTPRPVPYPVDQRTDCLVALQQGLVDAITSDDAILLGFKAQDPDTRIVGSAFAPDPYGMAISKQHQDFVAFVNGVLAKIRSDGTWRRIYHDWLKRAGVTRVPAPPHPTYYR